MGEKLDFEAILFAFVNDTPRYVFEIDNGNRFVSSTRSRSDHFEFTRIRYCWRYALTSDACYDRGGVCC